MSSLESRLDIRYHAHRSSLEEVQQDVRNLSERVESMQSLVNASVAAIGEMLASTRVGFETNLDFMRSMATTVNDIYAQQEEANRRRREENYQRRYAGSVSPIPEWLRDMANSLL